MNRFPLYAKILLWFFLNLLLLTIASFLLLRAQLRFGPDWLLAMGAGERIQMVSDVIVSELNDRPRAEWGTVLKRFNDAYKIQFLVFRADGTQLAGQQTELPPDVRGRFGQGRGFGRFRPPGEGNANAPEPPDAEGHDHERPPADQRDFGPPPWNGARGPLPKFLVHTTHPTRYWLIVPVPLSDPEHSHGHPPALIAESTTLSGGGLFFDFRPWLAVGLGAVVFSALLWFPFVRGITRSVGQMTHATRLIAEGRFDTRVDECRRDELGLLGQSINRLATRLGGFVTGQKRFLGDIAHELCSPIARIQMALGILEQRADDKQKAYVEDLREEVQHISNLVNELLSFSKASLGVSAIKLQPVPLRELAKKAIAREADESTSIRVEIPDDLSVTAEPELLLRSLSNLLRNALRYAGHAGPITVSAAPQAGEVLLTVSDCGPGVPEIELAQIFDPFYRLDASRNAQTGGVGLGLAIVKTCVESCRGTVTCRNRQPSGLEVTIKLPLALA